MIETTIISYLSNSISTSVYAERPENIPDKYVLIEKTGSSTENHITTSTIAIQSIVNTMNGGTLLDAMELNETVKAAMGGLLMLDEISKVSLNSDYNYTDDRTKEYRYQAVYQITHY